MSNISLSSGIRQNLFSLQQTSDLISLTQNRLATGKKVNSAIDNPTNFFVAQGLNSRAADLNDKLDGISNSLKTVEAADRGITGITKLVKNAQSIVSQARNVPEADRQKFVDQYNEIRTQITSLAKDSGFNGVNLLDGDNTDVVFNEKSGGDLARLTLRGVSYGTDDATTGILGGVQVATLATFADGAAATAGPPPVAASGLVAVDEQLNKALGTLREQASTLGSQLAIVQTRKDFTNELINTLKAGADNLVNANGNEEAANLLTLQTRQQLSSQALALASQQEQSVLRLLG